MVTNLRNDNVRYSTKPQYYGENDTPLSVHMQRYNMYTLWPISVTRDTRVCTCPKYIRFYCGPNVKRTHAHSTLREESTVARKYKCSHATLTDITVTHKYSHVYTCTMSVVLSKSINWVTVIEVLIM